MISIITQGKFHSEPLAIILKKKKLLKKYILFYVSKLIDNNLKSETHCANFLFLFYKIYIKIFRKDHLELC